MAGGAGSRWVKSFGDAPSAPLAHVAAVLSRQADKTPASVAVATCVGLMVQWTKARRDAFATRGEVPQAVSRDEYDAFVALFGPEHTALARASALLQSVRAASPALPSIVVAPYYHGAMSRGEAEELLKTTPPASRAFLVRLASEPGAFAFSSVDPAAAGQWERAALHILIRLDATGQYYFPTLAHIRGALPDVITGGCREGGITVAVQPSFLHTFTARPDVQRWMGDLESAVLSTPLDIAAPPPPASVGGGAAAFSTHRPPVLAAPAGGSGSAGYPVHRAQTAPEDGGAGAGLNAAQLEGRYGLHASAGASSGGTAGGAAWPSTVGDGTSFRAPHGSARASWHTHAVTAPATVVDSASVPASRPTHTVGLASHSQPVLPGHGVARAAVLSPPGYDTSAVPAAASEGSRVASPVAGDPAPFAAGVTAHASAAVLSWGAGGSGAPHGHPAFVHGLTFSGPLGGAGGGGRGAAAAAGGHLLSASSSGSLGSVGGGGGGSADGGSASSDSAMGLMASPRLEAGGGPARSERAVSDGSVTSARLTTTPVSSPLMRASGESDPAGVTAPTPPPLAEGVLGQSHRRGSSHAVPGVGSGAGAASPPTVAVGGAVVTVAPVPPTPQTVSRAALDLHRRLGQQAQRQLATIVNHERYPAVQGFVAADADRDADLVVFLESGRLNPAAAVHLTSDEHLARSEVHQGHAKVAFEAQRYPVAAEHFGFACAHAIMSGSAPIAIRSLCNCATSLLRQVSADADAAGKAAPALTAGDAGALVDDGGSGGGKYADMLQMCNALLPGAKNLTYSLRADDPLRLQWTSTVYNVTYLARETELAALKASAAAVTAAGTSGGGGDGGGGGGDDSTATLLATRLMEVVNDMQEVARAHLEALRASTAPTGAGAAGVAASTGTSVKVGLLRTQRQVEERMARTGDAGTVRVEVTALCEKLAVAGR